MQEAVGRGEFDNLPGTGKPLALDDDTLVLPELRAAYRVLKTLVMYRAISNCGRKSPILKPFSPLSTIRAPISDSTICVHSYKPLTVIRSTLGLSRPTIGSCSIGLTNSPFFSGEPA